MPSEGWSSLSKNSTNGRKLYRQLTLIRWAMRTIGALSSSLAGRLGFRLFRTTQRHRVPDREQGWLRSATPLEFEFEGSRLSGWAWGKGPTVLLMHGWGGRGSQMGAFAIRLAEAGFRAVALDAPGHGGSAGRLSSLPAFAGTVHRAAAELGPLHAVIAHSFGAAGTGWARYGGLEASRFVFVAAPGDLEGYVQLFKEQVGLSTRSFAHMIRRLEDRFDVDWQMCRYATTVASDETPMLVVHDRGDDETPYAGGLAIRDAWPNSRLVSTEGLGHRRILRDPEVVAEVVGFVAGRNELRAPEPDARRTAELAVS